MDGRELKLNSLSRYSKTSPLYVLEEHGHCEVPAGCGGVVLRWRNPRDGVPLTLWLYSAGEYRAFLDGPPPESARPLVSFGEHVLAFEIGEIDPAFMVLIFAGRYQPDGDNRVRSSGARGGEVSVLSAADGSWRYTFQEPVDDAWTRAGFDDSGWSSMVLREERRPPADPKRDPDRYRINQVTEKGGVGLGVTGDGTRVWVRKAFEISESVQGGAVTGGDDV
ncbi:hypothetical protein [Actinomadura sp. HBU206391]|uniref:hypothetical protein n=1 Tax=Actinomadura sp. HBU206391 TaxID=2731692 RepID=UPI001650C0C5|nr:hypothetical protein [Actinomadura sp. HBU206391]MBC6460198.1 hypothetical protein [Actinomadura sp. HBU206391]